MQDWKNDGELRQYLATSCVARLLRAQVTGGHSLVLAFALAVGFAFWLFLQSRVGSRGWKWVGNLAFVGGLVATFARGPWVGAGASILVFFVGRIRFC